MSTDTDMPPNQHEAFLLRHLDSLVGVHSCPPTASSSAARPVLPLGQGQRLAAALVSVVPVGAYTSCIWASRAPLASLEA